MSNKSSETTAPENHKDGEELRTAVDELNQNIAYLSRMVMQLQRSINGKKQPTQLDKKQPTLH